MNQLQSFLAEANAQVRGPGGATPAAATAASLLAEAFTHVGESPSVSRLGIFGNDTVVPDMERPGYSTYSLLTLTVERSLYATPPTPRGEIVRTATGETYFVQAIDSTPVIYTFTLTNRDVE